MDGLEPPCPHDAADVDDEIATLERVVGLERDNIGTRGRCLHELDDLVSPDDCDHAVCQENLEQVQIGQCVRLMQVRRLRAEDVALVAAIDRSEHVDVQYRVIYGQLRQVPAVITDVPAWDPTGSGPHTVAAEIAFCSSVVARGGILLGAFEGERTVGLAIVHPAFEPRLAWLAFLHVSRPYRRRGAAQGLWNAAADIAGAADAESIYVSATPTASAVGFYLRQQCQLANPVHPDLFAAEPDDIHFVCSLTRS